MRNMGFYHTGYIKSRNHGSFFTNSLFFKLYFIYLGKSILAMKLFVVISFLFFSVGLFAQSNAKVVDNDDVSVAIYPNPASEFLNINIKGGLTKGTIKIFSALGTEIYADELDSFKKIDLSDFKNNVYLVNIYSNEVLVQTTRFVVRH